MPDLEENSASWLEFGLQAAFSECWCCGRFAHEHPKNWDAPFLIERAHIVNSPRREDRRVGALLCSRCHRIQHGIVLADSLMLVVPTLAELIWLKWKHDRKYYDLAYLQANSLTKLPKAKKYDGSKNYMR